MQKEEKEEENKKKTSGAWYKWFWNFTETPQCEIDAKMGVSATQ